MRRKNGRHTVCCATKGLLDLCNEAISEKTLTNFVTCWVCDIDFRTNRRSRCEMWLNGQTDTQTDSTTATLAANARWRLTTTTQAVSTKSALALRRFVHSVCFNTIHMYRWSSYIYMQYKALHETLKPSIDASYLCITSVVIGCF